MLLLPGERVLRSAYAVADPDGRSVTVRSAGVLYLTNQRLVFESRIAQGRIGRLFTRGETELLLDVGLEGIHHLSIRPGRVRGPRLVVEAPTGRLAFDVLEPADWAGAIAEARRARPVLDPSGRTGVTTIVERQVVKLRCRYCGSLGNEADGRCPYCGAPL